LRALEAGSAKAGGGWPVLEIVPVQVVACDSAKSHGNAAGEPRRWDITSSRKQ